VQPRVRARGFRAEGGWTGGGVDRRVYARAYACGGREKGRTGEESYLRGRSERLEVIHRRETRERNIACEPMREGEGAVENTWIRRRFRAESISRVDSRIPLSDAIRE